MVVPKHKHKQTRRRLLTSLGASAVVAAGLATVPFVHSSPSRPAESSHAYWNVVLNHASQKLNPSPEKGSDWLRSWIATMLREPKRRICGLSLVGPECSGKTTFHKAVGLLLPDMEYAVTKRASFAELLVRHGDTRLVVLEGDTTSLPEKLKVSHSLLASRFQFRPDASEAASVPNMSHWMQVSRTTPEDFEPGEWLREIAFDQLKKPIPRRDLLRRLEDEQDAFMASLSDAAHMQALT